MWQADYTPFGSVNITTQTVTNNLRFPGQYYDQETGLHYNYFRYYDPSTGRYTTSDPIGLEGGLNTYVYAGGDPISLTDPSGMIFGYDTGESYGNAAVDYWASLQYQTGNPLYAIPGTLAEMWTPCHSNTTFLSLLPTGPAGRVLGWLAETKLLMGTKGTIGEALSIVNNMLKGSKLQARNRKTIPGYRTIVDSTWRSLGDTIYYVESKFGNSPLSNAQQVAADGLGELYRVERWGYDFVRNLGATSSAGLGTAIGSATSSCDCQ